MRAWPKLEFVNKSNVMTLSTPSLQHQPLTVPDMRAHTSREPLATDTAVMWHARIYSSNETGGDAHRNTWRGLSIRSCIYDPREQECPSCTAGSEARLTRAQKLSGVTDSEHDAIVPANAGKRKSVVGRVRAGEILVLPDVSHREQ